MKSPFLRAALPHLVAVAVFLVTSVLYCKPVLEGKVVRQADVMGYKGMAQQSVEYKEKNGHFPLWTQSTFSGMPTYNIDISPKNAITLNYLGTALTLGLPKPICFFFLACISFYILTLVLRIDPWIGVLAAIGYAWASYDPVIIIVGHETKMLALGYMPGVFAGLLLIFQRKYLGGAALFLFFIAMVVGTQHLQVLYYTFLGLGLLTLAFLVHSYYKKQLRHAFQSVAIAIVAGGIGLCTYALILLPLQEYAKETMRGGRTELTAAGGKEASRTGLSKDYAFQWSYGIGETFTLLVPNIYGGGSDGQQVGNESAFAQKMSEEFGQPEDAALQSENGITYWGGQEMGTSGTVYLGAVICLLFLFGAVYVRGWQKWWLVSVAALGIVLAWGKHFSAFNYFLFDHLPYYNKFRAPTIALIMPQFAFPLLGALGLQQLIYGQATPEEKWKKLKTAGLVMGAILALLAVYYLMADYKGSIDERLKDNLVNGKMQQLAQGKQPTAEMQQQAMVTGNAVIKALQQDRQSLFGSDLLRSILLIAIAFGLIWLYIRNKVNKLILLGGLLVLSTFDVMAVGRRYLNEDHFVDPSEIEGSFTATPADLQINRDPEKGFRVFDETGSPFQQSQESARTSYFHNSVGGYHPAKLGLYQDLIDSQLLKMNVRVYNMLNTKYFIEEDPATRQPVAKVNPGAYGPCWLVKGIHYVKDGIEEMKALDSVNTRDTAIIQEAFRGTVKFPPVPDSSASIRLLANHNDTVDYQFSAKTNQFAVLSEIYYPHGWKAFIDGKAADYCRVDYILRGLSVPAGDHQIEFRFEPKSYNTGSNISTIAAILGWLLLLAAAGDIVWRKRKAAWPRS
ncbi:MAG: YfhO family protein [Bacteroidota bacterium]|nr:YfhO family protein [Bacteroidota bacterium]